MEDKSFELLTKMYSEFKEFKTNMEEFKTNMEGFEQRTNNSLMIMENNNDANFKALFDGYKQVYEKITVVEQEVKALSAKVDKHEVEIKVIKGGKAKKLS